MVEEVLREDVRRRLGSRSSSRRFAVYALEKTSLTTPGACARLSRALGVVPAAVDYAGLKDKHAHTTQHVSVGPAEGELPASVSGEGWAARLVGWSDGAAEAAWIRRNRFILTVRGLTSEQAEQMDARAGRLALSTTGPVRLLVVNYFGEQRFGSARHGKGFVARHLIRGEFEEALRLAIGTPSRKDTGARRALSRALAERWGRWAEVVAECPRCVERRSIEVLAAGGDFRDAFAALPFFLQQMCIEAYQSHLWNETARRVVEASAPGDASGTPMVCPAAASVPFAARSIEVPMLAPSTKLAEPWRSAAEAVLQEEGITLASLAIPGLRRPAFGEAWRTLYAMAECFEAGPVEPDDLGHGRLKRTLRFELPRGAYATIVLRALGC